MAKDDIKEGVKICDPACGVGKFLLEPIKNNLDYYFEISDSEIKSKITIHGFDKGFDTEEQKTIILAKANMLIYFSDLIKDNPGFTKNFAKLFNDSFVLKTNSILGTLSEPAKEEYDLILTNPPYVTSGSSNLKDEIKKDGELINYYKINAMGVEGLFLEWIIRALKRNGKAFIVVPDGILNRQNDKHLRRFIIDECYLDGIISLPIKTFFTTPKKTYILALTKKANNKEIQKNPVFTYLVSDIGETLDVYRFDIDQDDLKEAVKLYSFFKGDKVSFNSINNDKRCKIQPFSKFIPEEHWSVDRWWTKEEKIELGILEEEKVVDLDYLSEFIKAVSDDLNGFSENIKEIAEKKKEIIEFKEISLKDKNYFDLYIGKRILKKDIIHFTGDIPIYSANVYIPVGYNSESNIKEFNHDHVLWGIDGDFEFNYIKKNIRFSTTDHCGAIRILDYSILPEYLMIQLDNVKHIYGFDRGLRASLKNMKKVSIKFPLTMDGDICREKQQDIVNKYKSISEIKEHIAEQRKQILKMTVEIQSYFHYKELTINEIFDLTIKTNSSNFTKTFVNKNKGKIPVYSASSDPEYVNYGYIKDNLPDVKYFENCLTWNIDGSIGKVHYRKDRFSLSEKVIPLILKADFENEIDKIFLKYAIEIEFSKHFFGFGNKAGKGKIKDIKILIPVNSQKEIDLETQKQIAEKYRNIEEIKNAISGELKKIENAQIELD